MKDARAVPILLALRDDPDVASIVPSALGQIGDQRALAPLLRDLDDKDPDRRALAACALEALGDKAALPRLRLLLTDQERIRFDGGGLRRRQAGARWAGRASQPRRLRIRVRQAARAAPRK